MAAPGATINWKGVIGKHREVTDCLLPMLITIMAFLAVKQYLFYAGSPTAQLLDMAAVTAIAILGSGLRLSQAPGSYRILIRIILGLFIFYHCFAYPAVAAGVENPGDPFSVFSVGRYIAIACGVLGMARPGFGLILLIYTVWQKHLLSQDAGLWISPTDYMTVVEIGIFLILALLVVHAIEHPQVSARLRYFNRDADASHPASASRLEFIFLCAVAVHFSNYFYSGHAKLVLEGAGPLTWILENQTQYLMQTAHEVGALPIEFGDETLGALYRLLTNLVVPMNFIVVAGQLVSVIAIMNVRWSMALTFFYDLMHVMIFLLTGIFFWKWIVLNIGLLFSLRTMLRTPLSSSTRISLVVVVLLAPSVFFVSRLGWFDTRSLNHSRTVAVMDDGSEISVPTNYFLSESVTFAQLRVGRPFGNHFPTGTYGNTYSLTSMELANRCGFELTKPSELESSFSDGQLERYFRRHHNFVLPELDESGRIAYDFYPHHIWSNPRNFTAFSTADKRKITAYKYIVESKCLDYSNGSFTSQTLLSGSKTIDVL